MSINRENGTITIPIPKMAPFGIEIDEPKYVQEVWDAFIKPGQDAGMPQSIEERALMGILRAVYAGMADDGSAGEMPGRQE